MKTLPTIAELRQQGNKVKVLHFRYPTKNSDLVPIRDMQIETEKGWKYQFNPEERGGKTEIFITTKDGKELHGEALCSKKENFSRKLGLRISLARALETKE